MRKHYVVPLEKKERSKCRKWQLRVDSGRRTPSGCVSWKTRKVTGKTWTQANEMCDQWAADLEEGRAVAPARKWTFGEYRKHWVEALEASGAAAENTVSLRRNALKAAGLHLDRYRLEDIRSCDVDAMVAALRRGETMSGNPASGTYAAKVVESVRLMLDGAVKDGLVAANAARDAHKPKTDTRERRPVSMVEVALLESQMDPREWHQRAVILLAETGMRVCEAVALKWGDWDEAAGLLRVTTSKNESGLRYVPVTRTLEKALSAARFHLQLELSTEDISGFGMLCDDAGQSHSKKLVQSWWRKKRARYGFEGVVLHQLRHAMVSQLLANGATLKQVQDIIGDKTASVVLNVYAHSSMEERSEAMTSLDETRRVQIMYKNSEP